MGNTIYQTGTVNGAGFSNSGVGQIASIIEVPQKSATLLLPHFTSPKTAFVAEPTENNSSSIAYDPGRIKYNAQELMQLGNIEPSYLMPPIFPKKSTAVIAGKPGIGKSMLARQLCINVAVGLNEFIGFDLSLTHQSAIYISTEDHIEATTYLLHKQLGGMEMPANENLRFIFADSLSQSEILFALKNDLHDKPADLVVIDSFGDIFSGSDSNNNIEMRRTVQAFNKIANQFGCLILFVHHINKGAYNQIPSQDHIQGGGGLVQKVRLAIILTEGQGSIRYFTVVKGNYTPKAYRESAIELIFDEEDFLFESTGETIPVSELTSHSTAHGSSNDSLVQLATQVLGTDSISYTQLVDRIMQFTGKSEATAKRNIKKMRNQGILVESDQGLSVQPVTAESTIIDTD